MSKWQTYKIKLVMTLKVKGHTFISAENKALSYLSKQVDVAEVRPYVKNLDNKGGDKHDSQNNRI